MNSAASTPRLESAATSARSNLQMHINKRYIDRFVDLTKCGRTIRGSPQRYCVTRAQFGTHARAVLRYAATGWRLEREAIAIRGSRLGLTPRHVPRYQPRSDRPITVRAL